MLKYFLNIFKNIIETIFPPKPRTGIDCVIRLGLPGSGKTLDQTEKEVMRYLLDGEEVWCCYWINYNGANLHYFNEFEEVESLRNCVIVFDEIGQILPARQWADEGIRVQLFFQLHRHRHLTIIANTQDVSLVAKTVGIIANRWLYIEKANNRIIDFILDLLRLPYVVLNKTEMSYQGLKKMANGWELEQTMASDEKSKKAWYSVEKILHKELNNQKIEIVHKYCPKCAMRQGSMILKEDTLNICQKSKKGVYSLKELEYCPKHKDQLLSVRESGIYDTDHEPEFKEKDVTFQAMIDSPAGYTKIKYGARLSLRQAEYKQSLENKQAFL